jgi:membrane protein YqaA with SNARE-associated domain
MSTSPDDATTASAGLLRECRAVFDWWERFTSDWRGPSLMFAWAVAEATVWPIIPDFLLCPMAAGNRRRFYLPLLAAIAGTALGGIATFLFAWSTPDRAADLLHHLPLVHDQQIIHAHDKLNAEGARALLSQPWSGISFKVWGVQAGILKLDPWLVIPAFVCARAVRMTLFATLSRVGAGLFTGFVRDFSIFVAIVYVVLFFYGWWQVVG